MDDELEHEQELEQELELERERERGQEHEQELEQELEVERERERGQEQELEQELELERELELEPMTDPKPLALEELEVIKQSACPPEQGCIYHGHEWVRACADCDRQRLIATIEAAWAEIIRLKALLAAEGWKSWERNAILENTDGVLTIHILRNWSREKTAAFALHLYGEEGLVARAEKAEAEVAALKQGAQEQHRHDGIEINRQYNKAQKAEAERDAAVKNFEALALENTKAEAEIAALREKKDHEHDVNLALKAALDKAEAEREAALSSSPDDWLKRHDAEVRAQAFEEAATICEKSYKSTHPLGGPLHTVVLRDRAAKERAKGGEG